MISSSSSDAVVAQTEKNFAVRKRNKSNSLLASSILRLFGHEEAIYGVDFSPLGDCLASCSFDRTIYLWNVYGECNSFGVLRGHKNSVGSVRWVDNDTLVSCSADKNAAVWDARSASRIRQLKGHTSFVNDIAVSKNQFSHMAATVSDDRQLILWDIRTRHPQQFFPHRYPLLAVALSSDPDVVYCGGIDNRIYVWDLRKGSDSPRLILVGHQDTLTGLDVTNDASFLCSHSMDNTIRIWDVRPFFQGSDEERCLTILRGASHSFERNLLRCRFSSDGTLVGAGSADKFVYIWDVDSGELQYALPGHDGSVNDLAFHPKESLVASASSDKTIYIGEIQKTE
jgi:Prp8 binding protein